MKINPKILATATVVILAIVFGVIVYYVSKSFARTCGAGGQMFDPKINACREKCDQEIKHCDPATDPSCQHYDYDKRVCATCPPHKLWSGKTCVTNCNDRGYFNASKNECVCTAGSEYAPLDPPRNPNGSLINPGWSGPECTISSNKCLSAPGVPGAPENLRDKDGTPCSGHGSLRNNGDYTACECVCDAGWTGEKCETGIPGQFLPANKCYGRPCTGWPMSPQIGAGVQRSYCPTLKAKTTVPCKTEGECSAHPELGCDGRLTRCEGGYCVCDSLCESGPEGQGQCEPTGGDELVFCSSPLALPPEGGFPYHTFMTTGLTEETLASTSYFCPARYSLFGAGGLQPHFKGCTSRNPSTPPILPVMADDEFTTVPPTSGRDGWPSVPKEWCKDIGGDLTFATCGGAKPCNETSSSPARCILKKGDPPQTSLIKCGDDSDCSASKTKVGCAGDRAPTCQKGLCVCTGN